MKTLKTLTVALVALMFVSTLVLAQDDENAAKRRRRGNRPEQGRDGRGPQGQDGKGPQGRRPGEGGMPGGFLFSYMKNHEEYKTAFDKLREAQEGIHKELRALREETRKKLEAATTDEEKQQIIADAKAKTEGLFTKLVGQMIDHRKEITGMLEEDKADIVAEALKRIYERKGEGEGQGPGKGRLRGAEGEGEGTGNRDALRKRMQERRKNTEKNTGGNDNVVF